MDRIYNILLIHNEKCEPVLISEVLGRVSTTQYQLSCCDDLAAAEEKVLLGEFDAILLDYHWGDSNCLSLLTTAQTQGCKIPIIVMTAEMEDEVDHLAIDGGAADYLILQSTDSQTLERAIRYAIDRKHSEQKWAQLAHYDPLTNIPNRILFNDRLNHALRLAERDNGSFTLMYMDLDGFKQVNDNFGHAIGDEVIKNCASRLQSCMRKSDSVARIGGDEFTILLENTDSAADVAHIAEKIIRVVSRPYQLANHHITIGCCIGIASYPGTGSSIDDLQTRADRAMYQAKKQGNHYCFYTEELNNEVQDRLRVESELHRALLNEEFILHYQPKLDVKTHRIIGVEALIRWQHPERGLLYPESFLYVAETTGILIPIGYWVMERACRDLKVINDLGLDLSMCINLSLSQFRDEKLVERFAAMVKVNDINAEKIEFEITEREVMENIELVSLHMRALKRVGCSFALDNFGTGFSSLNYLLHLPINTVKIDRELIAEISKQEEASNLVGVMVEMAQNLNKEVTAEGIECDAQLQLLEVFKCDHVQGDYLFPPMPLEQLLDTKTPVLGGL